jgi:hypothetical protein
MSDRTEEEQKIHELMMENLELTRQTTEARQDGIGALRTIEEVEKMRNARQKESIRLEKEKLELLNDHAALLENETRLRIESLDQAMAGLKAIQDEGKKNAEILKAFEDSSGALYKEMNQMAASMGMTMKEFAEEAAAAKSPFDYISKHAGITKTRLENSQKVLKQTTEVSGKFANSMGLASKASATTSGKIFEMGIGMYQANRAGLGFGKILTAQFKTVFNVQAILFQIVDLMGKFVLQTDTVARNFQKTRGFSMSFRDTIQDVSSDLVAAGVSAEDAASGLGALASKFSAFGNLSKEQTTQLTKTVVMLNQFGVSAEDSAKSMDFFVRSMNTSLEDAEKLTVEIATMGDQMGVSASKMMSDFKSVSGTLAMYGPRAVDEFEKLAAASRATGIEVSSLLALGQKFDTFSDAAGNAGKLNAVLGTNISAMEMMNMTEAERVQTLREQIKLRVGNFDNLNKYQQMFVKETLGLKDVAEARALVNQSEEEYLDNLSKQEASKKTQEEVLKLQQELVPVAQQLKLAFMKAILGLKPLMAKMNGLIDSFVSFVQFISGPLEVAFKILAGAFKATVVILEVLMYAVGGVMAILGVLAVVTAGPIAIGIGVAVAAVTGLLYYFGQLGTVLKYVGGMLLLVGALIVAGVSAPLTAAIAIIGVFVAYWDDIVDAFQRFFDVSHLSGSPMLYQMFGYIAEKAEMFGGVLKFLLNPFSAITSAFEKLMPFLSGAFHSFTDFLVNIPSLGANLLSAAGGMFKFASSIKDAAGSLDGFNQFFQEMFSGDNNIIEVSTSLGSIGDAFGSLSVLVDGGGLTSAAESFKSLVADAANFTAEGFVSVSPDGGLVVGAGEVMQQVFDGNLAVEVKMPDFQLPEITLNVNIDKNGKVNIEKIIGGS